MDSFDPKLRERLRAQEQKVATGESAVEGLDSPKQDATSLEPKQPVVEELLSPSRRAGDEGFDPKLRERLRAQEQKVATGESAVEGFDSPKQHVSPLEPKLAERWRRQEAKLATGENLIDEELLTPSRRTWDEGFDPKLRERLKAQELKVATGESAVEGLDSPKQHVSPLEPKLAERLRRQEEKNETGENAVEELLTPSRRAGDEGFDPKLLVSRLRHVDTPAKAPSRVEEADIVDPILAVRLEQQRQKALAASDALAAPAADDGAGVSSSLRPRAENAKFPSWLVAASAGALLVAIAWAMRPVAAVGSP